ncbi:MAG: hypothetical protein C6W57_00210 [Caldibacillus debilis]|nr:MAG: hypothetical protein C6W57_00210 [Caldibacillus debilis]
MISEIRFHIPEKSRPNQSRGKKERNPFPSGLPVIFTNHKVLPGITKPVLDSLDLSQYFGHQ